MIISNKTSLVRTAYDHGPLTSAALAEPGTWFSDDGDDYPTISPGQIRRGAMKDYRPAGAFTARRIEGRIYISFIGVPKHGWDPDDAGPFASVERTLNPGKCPDDTPEHVLEALRKLRKKKAKKKPAQSAAS